MKQILNVDIDEVDLDEKKQKRLKKTSNKRNC